MQKPNSDTQTTSGLTRVALPIGILLFIVFAIVAWAISSGDDAVKSSAPTSKAKPAADKAPAAETETPDIVDTALGAGDFSTLIAAVQAAGLEETLRGEGPYTVFAPTDAAFAKLPAGTVDDLLKPENKQKLTDILTYHVVPGSIMSTDLTDGQQAETVLGQNLTVSLDKGVMVGDATVTKADIETSNGVIHVVDTVLLPPAK